MKILYVTFRLGFVIVKKSFDIGAPKAEMRILIVDRSEGHLQSWSVLPIGQVS